MRIKMTIFTALIFVLAACLPAQTPVDMQPQINTAVAQAMQTSQNQIEESVALTVAAQQAESTPTAVMESTPTEVPTLVPTSVPLDIPTPTMLVPTATGYAPTSSGSAPKPAEYACNAINRRPKDNTEYNRGAKFDIKWTIVNTGTKTLPKGIDVKYFSGPKMSNVLRVEIPVALAPGQSYVVDLDAKAPDTRGFHVMTWTLDGQLCYPYVAINVK